MSKTVEGSPYDVNYRCLMWALCEVNETADFRKLNQVQIAARQMIAYCDNLQIVLGVLLEENE